MGAAARTREGAEQEGDEREGDCGPATKRALEVIGGVKVRAPAFMALIYRKKKKFMHVCCTRRTLLNRTRRLVARLIAFAKRTSFDEERVRISI